MEIRSSETRTAESLAARPLVTTHELHEMEGPHLYSIRWSAILAGLAVGLGIQVLLMLIGVAAGFAVFGAGQRPEGESITVAAGIWNTVSMLISAFIGGYVASRASGLRRTSDGMLHGVVSWGATMLFFSLMTGSVTGNALSRALGVATNTAVTATAARPGDSAVGELLSSLERGDRTSAIGVLENRFGMSSEQARRAADQALTMTGRSPAGADTRTGEVSNAAQAASAASAWLSGAILLSLLAGAGGGLLGARGSRRRALPDRHAVTTTVHRRVPTAG
jgi:hypothetical protein